MIREDLGWLPTWPPTLGLEPGMIVVPSDITVRPVSQLQDTIGVQQYDLGITSEKLADRTMSKAGSVRFLVRDYPATEPGRDAGESGAFYRLVVQMLGERASLAVMKDVTERHLTDIAGAKQLILDLASKGAWENDWVLVTHVMTARSGLILASGAEESSAEFKLPAAGLTRDQSQELDPVSALGDPALEIVGTSHIAGHIIFREGWVPCFKAIRVRRKFFGPWNVSAADVLD
jgi:hypothetical protein